MKQYRSDTGMYVPTVTRTQMKELDRIAIEETGPSLYQMMENAGRSCALAALEMLGTQWKHATVMVLAGSGGNGGGGICAARHLANRSQGIDVYLCLSTPEKLGDVPAYQRKIFGSTHGKECELEQLAHVKPSLIIDALVGYSLHGAPTGKTAELIQWANENDAPVLSLDIPSGVDAATGETPGQFINATRTVTLALPKTGLHPETTGDLWLADIGIPQRAFQKLGMDYTSPFENRFLIPLQHN
ncbi:MAG TPA: NAD(P)H-hydrate epimerase [Nitrospirales bacterium]|nr:NAD(P)H-hydrate epimerase [Nitrospirales bacterium]